MENINFMSNPDSTKKVFFLGAGFSKAINHKYPLLSELNEEIKPNIIKGELFKCYRNICSKIGENIEELLAYLSLDLPWKTEYTKTLDKALYIDITKNISATINSLNTMPDKYDYDQEQEQVRLLADFIKENLSLCLTLNYDTLLEKIIFSKKDENYQRSNGYEGFYKVPIQSVADRWKISTSAKWGFGSEDPKGKKLPTILKLHGSINWMWAGISPSDPIYCSDKNDSIQEINNSVLELQPFIVPPALDKNSFYNNNILKSIWSLAYKGLMKSKEIYIIGFSLPDSDISIKYFFKEVMSKNKDRNTSSTIYVINTDESDELKKRYKNVFPEESLNFDYCCQYAFDRFVKEKLSANL